MSSSPGKGALLPCKFSDSCVMGDSCVIFSAESEFETSHQNLIRQRGHLYEKRNFLAAEF